MTDQERTNQHDPLEFIAAQKKRIALLEETVRGLRKALKGVCGNCECRSFSISACPQCGNILKQVRYPQDSMLNEEQFMSVRAGDWYCIHCKGTEAKSGHKYWWDKDLEQNKKTCARCAAIAKSREVVPE